MDRIPWTDKEVERIKIMVESRATLADLAVVFRSRTRTALQQKLRAVGLKIYEPSPDIDESAFKRFLKEKGGK